MQNFVFGESGTPHRMPLPVILPAMVFLPNDPARPAFRSGATHVEAALLLPIIARK
jgi:hypothetical protein